jgi:hypothetical protein
LLESGGEYFNLKMFPEGEATTALWRIMNTRMGKGFDSDSAPLKKPRENKKQAKELHTLDPASVRNLVVFRAHGSVWGTR